MDIEKLKQKILDLAIRGKLVPQESGDESAPVLFEKMQLRKKELAKDGNCKKTTADSYIYKGTDGFYYEKIGANVTRIKEKVPNTDDDWFCLFRLDQICKEISAGGDRPSVFSKTKNNICKHPIFSNGIEDNGLYGFTDVAKINEPAITVSARGTIGFPCIRTEPYTPIVRLISVIPLDFIDIEYLYLFFCLEREKGEGTSTPQLTVPSIKQKIIPICSLKRQKRIVAFVKELFASLDLINEDYSEIEVLADRAKLKILDSIFSDSGTNNQKYGERFKTTLEKLVPANKIGDGDWVLSEDMDENGDYKIVQLKHIGFGKYIDKSYKSVNEKFYREKSCSEICENYLLINRLVSDFMSVCLLPKLQFKTITSVDVCWIAPSNEYNQKYLMYYLLSPQFQKLVMLKSSGSTRKRISKRNLVAIQMSIHNREKQELVVKDIEEAFLLLDSMKE